MLGAVQWPRRGNGLGRPTVSTTTVVVITSGSSSESAMELKTKTYQVLRGALAESQVWFPKPAWLLTVHNSSSRGFRTLFWPPPVPGMSVPGKHKVYTHTCRQNAHTHKIKINI